MEKFWRFVARTILGVFSQAPNLAVLGELVWFAFKAVQQCIQALKVRTRLARAEGGARKCFDV